MLDFLVIGAQKAGTTSVWRYLRGHPQLFMPASKEAPLFTGADLDPARLPLYMETFFADAPEGALLGKVTPDYMVGEGRVPVEEVAERIASTLPEVRLVALLRDPLERAVSSYMMAVRRGQDKRSLDVALDELLRPERLEDARALPGPTTSYVAAGEYGRILGAYLERFPAEQLLVAFTEDLERDPGAVLDAVLGHLGIPPGYRPEGLGMRHFQGGPRKLLDEESERRLREFFTAEVMPRMAGPNTPQKRLLFDFFLETWNVAPGERPPDMSAEVRAKLEAHFRGDAVRLGELGIEAPWTGRWLAPR